VDISLEQQGNSAVVLIRDYGPGVPETSLPLLFNAFYRVERDRARSSGGVGLGLAIAKRALELHKGTLSARNENPGLLVELSLPIEPAIAFAGRLP
jgi:two-component system sensor histidine kinase CpxA